MKNQDATEQEQPAWEQFTVINKRTMTTDTIRGSSPTLHHNEA